MGRKGAGERRREPKVAVRDWTWILLCLAMLFNAGVRIRLLEMPFERDEGEYAYAGQLILQGIPPYSLAYNMKFPGVYASYALLMAGFGESVAGVHLGVLLVNLTAIVFVYVLGRRLFGRLEGAAAAAAYSLLSVSPSVCGAAGHATHFIVLFALAGTLLLLRAEESGRRGALTGSGVLFGLALLMKQAGASFALFGGLRLAWSRWRKHPATRAAAAGDLALFSLGVALPFALSCLVLLLTGTFSRFWFWTFRYAREYVAQRTLADGLAIFGKVFPEVAGPQAALWLVAGGGLVALALDRTARRQAPILLQLAIFSFLGVCPGFYFREHYFIMLLPAVALLAGLAVGAARRWAAGRRWPAVLQRLPLLLFAAALAQGLFSERDVFFQLTPVEVSRRIYEGNPFPESLEIARYVAARSAPEERIAVLGSEPQIYFYAHRRSATGYIYTYGLMEEQPFAAEMQREMIREIESARPLYLIVVNISPSWLWTPRSERLLFSWLGEFLRGQYELEGAVDIGEDGRTDYSWGREAVGRRARAPDHLLVYRRTGE